MSLCDSIRQMTVRSSEVGLLSGWWRGVVVTHLIRSAKLLYAEPG